MRTQLTKRNYIQIQDHYQNSHIKCERFQFGSHFNWYCKTDPVAYV